MEINLEQITLGLPPANESYEWQGVKFDIYLVKNFYTDKWENESLRHLTTKCREAFFRYGNVPVEDKYDTKSLVTLVGVSYMLEQRLVKEWLSIRLVPAFGAPFLSEDLLIKFKDQNNLFQLISKLLLDEHPDSAKKLFTISRFCGIAPYFQDNFELVDSQNKLKFTALSFVLLCKFVLKYLETSNDKIYITAMFHHDIYKRVSFIKHNDSQAFLNFPNTHETLSVSPSVLENFHPGEIVFRHPTYFFKINELISWCKKMLTEEKINYTHLNHILKSEIKWSDIEEELQKNKLEVAKKLSLLGELFSGDKVLNGGSLNRDQLRKQLDEQVPKSLVLKLINRSDLKNSIDKFLKDLNFFK